MPAIGGSIASYSPMVGLTPPISELPLKSLHLLEYTRAGIMIGQLSRPHGEERRSGSVRYSNDQTALSAPVTQAAGLMTGNRCIMRRKVSRPTAQNAMDCQRETHRGRW